MSTLVDEERLLRSLDYKECAADPVEFVSRHCIIEEKQGRQVAFELWPFQEETLQTVHGNNAVIVLKARQLGATWLALSYALWMAIFYQGSRILIMCKTDRAAWELLDRMRRQFQHLQHNPASSHLVEGLEPRRDAAETLDVGRSVVRALAPTERSARQETATLVILDEFAYTQAAKLVWQATVPSVNAGGKLWVISTGNGRHGQGKQFAELWKAARKGESPLVPIFHPWFVHPGRSPEWYAEEERMMQDSDQMRVEYPTEESDAFAGLSENAVYSLRALDAAIALGAKLDEMRVEGTIPPPDGGEMGLGIDWGLVTTHALLLWPLPGGGMYIPPGEVVVHRGEIQAMSVKMLDRAALYDYRLDETRYDAAAGYAMETFKKIAPADMGYFGVDFGKRKNRTIAYIRTLLARTLLGEEIGLLAISPKNEVLIQELMDLKQDEQGRVIKGNDHGADALIAGLAPVAYDMDAEELSYYGRAE